MPRAGGSPGQSHRAGCSGVCRNRSRTQFAGAQEHPVPRNAAKPQVDHGSDARFAGIVEQEDSTDSFEIGRTGPHKNWEDRRIRLPRDRPDSAPGHDPMRTDSPADVCRMWPESVFFVAPVRLLVMGREPAVTRGYLSSDALSATRRRDCGRMNAEVTTMFGKDHRGKNGRQLAAAQEAKADAVPAGGGEAVSLPRNWGWDWKSIPTRGMSKGRLRSSCRSLPVAAADFQDVGKRGR